MWVVFALLSAVCAALTSILAKIGIEGVNSNLATAIRTGVVLVLAWGIVFAGGVHKELAGVGGKSWLFWFCPAWRRAAPGCFFIKRCRWGARRAWCRWIS